ncbi:MAG: hypothetical protein JNJ83_17915 [Verrucomicrobiaceae bacterium]|nr:hypothetical protein [Verrucomicrobiaceae bacterium]
MKRSEKILLGVFAALFTVIIGGGALAWCVKTYNKVAAERDRLETRLDEMSTALAQGSEWQKRSQWLEEHTPKFSSHEEASSQLFDLAQKASTEVGIKIGAREMIPQRTLTEGESEGYYDKATVKITFAEVSEEPFFKWVYDLTVAKPQSFVGVTRLQMTPSPSGKTINAEVELTQFYAQTAPAKLTRAQ